MSHVPPPSPPSHFSAKNTRTDFSSPVTRHGVPPTQCTRETLKKKIVLKVELHCQRERTKALEIASQIDGVEYEGYQREKEDGDEVLVVIEDGVDAVKLVKPMRRKVGWTKLLSVGDHKESA
ncbi:hypothetical protein MLD38_019458 [Melastoma candidum]|uniref:Uncharacterized protein n=1 Tax=Melastoma candidum TaxID=119954 RepID=A0ACB9QYC9_9MYRT|nr:hypothetical protein MLD38_019458 [Melastoma candidum]